jgi:hypothetical protein
LDFTDNASVMGTPVTLTKKWYISVGAKSPIQPQGLASAKTP